MSKESQGQQSESGDRADSGPGESGSVYRYLIYGLSLPERAIRTTSGIVGGAVKESATYLVPQTFRNSRTYRSFVGQMLEFMVNDVAGVPKTAAESKQHGDLENEVARKSVGSFIDLAGMATLHVSPLTVMAVISDVAHGSNHYLKELAQELKNQGVLESDDVVNSTSDLLQAIGAASGKTHEALETPPLSTDGLLETITQIRNAVAQSGTDKVISQAEIDETWNEMSDQAEKQNVTLFQLSSTMTLATLNGLSTVTQGALSTIRVTGNMLDRHIFRHYVESLGAIGDRGLYPVLSESSQPYIDAMWTNFSSERSTITENLVNGKLLSKVWGGMRSWVGDSRSTNKKASGDRMSVNDSDTQ